MPWSDFHFVVLLSSHLEDCTQHVERERERERERDMLGLLGREITVKDLFRKKFIYDGVGGFARMGGYGVLGA
jgi:hypothetical protein